MLLDIVLYSLATIGAATLLIFAAGVIAYQTDVKRYARRD